MMIVQTRITRLKRFYEKDGLPPCLRARNLKYQLKTRSLDEEEFNKEFDLKLNTRRKSLDEGMGYKTNSLPKTLNPPKSLPKNDSKVDSIHIAHSTENVNCVVSEEEEQKKRERIEKYKEERRRILQDKYRSESFKEDKEVLLNRLRIFKHKDELVDTPELSKTTDRPPRSRRRSTRSEDSADSLEEDPPIVKPTPNSIPPRGDTPPLANPSKKEAKPIKESLKSRAAIFEQNNQRMSATPDLRPNKNRSSFKEPTKQTDYAKNVQDTREIYGSMEKKENFDDLKDLDFIRNKKKDEYPMKEERRRHTFDTRERETETDRLRRISLESRSPK